MRNSQLREAPQGGRLDFLFGADGDVNLWQDRTDDNAEHPRVMPLVCPKIQIQVDYGTVCLRLFGGVTCGTPTRLLAQPSAAYQHGSTLGNRRGEDIVNRELNIGTIVAIKDERKPVRRFNAENDSTRSVPRLVRDELRRHAFIFQKLEQEFANRVFADSGE